MGKLDNLLNAIPFGAISSVGLSVMLVIAAVGVPAVALFGTTTVDPGERGVYVRNGQVQGTVGNGIHMMVPGADRIRVFNMRTTKFTTSASALTNDNINVQVEVAVRWDIQDDKLTYVYKNVAVSQQKLVDNAVRDAVVSGIKSSRQFNSGELSSVEYREAVRDRIEELFQRRGLKLTSVTIKNIKYPQSVEKKFQQRKQSQAQLQIAENKLEVAKKERERKLIEARAKRDAIETKREAISPEYIAYIQARNIDKGDTVYVIPRSTNSTQVTNEVTP